MVINQKMIFLPPLKANQYMYKVFVNDKPIVLTTVVCKETDFKNYLLKSVKIGKVIKDLNKSSIKEVRLIGKNEDKLFSIRRSCGSCQYCNYCIRCRRR